MKARHSRWMTGLLSAALVALAAEDASAQTTMPSTLRFGSGYLDVPSASVLPHLAIQGTYSGWFAESTPNLLIVDPSSGAVLPGTGGMSEDDYYQDISLTLGLFDRVELGGTLQQASDEDNGGTMFGLFGQLALLKPGEYGGLGLAAGVRYMSAPDYGDGVDYQPNRLGFSDRRVRGDYDGSVDNFDSEVTLYGVGTINVAGPDASFLPENDVTFSLGYGNGLFKEGGEFDWYTNTDSNGWFAASSWAWGLGESSLLHLIGEWNGFDLNTGLQLDLDGIRLGAHVLGLNHGSNVSIFRSRKLGFLVSTGLCPGGEGLLCGTRMVERVAPDTVQLPAPPPDTVVVTREVAPELPTGSPANVCLATGQNVQVLLTAQGDTLVGPARVSIETLRPGVVFAGTYADGRGWFENDESVMFEENSYDKSGNESQLQCNQIMRVGEFQGVPLFSMRNAERPFQMLYVPVRPGVWQPYETGLQSTRGDF